MRISFISTLEALAVKNKNIILLTPDMGFSVFEQFREKFPGRFINTGIAEANTIGIAAGLALEGKIVYVYSIVPFVTMRCFEQIRMDLCYQRLKVRLVGVGGGVCYGTAGASHHAIEDIALMRALPSMTVVCPGDPYETTCAIQQSLAVDGPMYIRLAKNKDPIIHNDNIDFEIGKAITIREGKDIALIATGGILYNAKVAAGILVSKGYDVCLISMHTIKPLDIACIKKVVKSVKALFTIEEHSLIGGLGSAVAEVFAENAVRDVYFERIALPDAYADCIGNQAYLHKRYGLLPEQIVEKVLKKIKG